MDCFESRIIRIFLPLIFVTFCIYFVPIDAELKRIKQPAKDDGSLSFLAIGDWGRKGWYNQSIVAMEVYLLIFFDYVLLIYDHINACIA